MARGKATKKKGKDMKTIFVIVIVVLVLAFVLFMQYQKPVVEDEEGLAQMLPRGGNGGDGGDGKPSSDFKLIPPKSFDCPANEMTHCDIDGQEEIDFLCSDFALACMYYCIANGWNCCMMDIWEKRGEKGDGHVVMIGQVEPEPSTLPNEHRFCIFEPQFGPDEHTPCCWNQRGTKHKVPNRCILKPFKNVGDIVCSTDLKDFEKITSPVEDSFFYKEDKCNRLNVLFDEAGYPGVEFCPKKGVL